LKISVSSTKLKKRPWVVVSQSILPTATCTTPPTKLFPPAGLFLYLRFIDDLFFIINKPDDIHDIILAITNDHINYEITPPSKTQNFLDTTIFITHKNVIILEPHSEDTASGAYLHPASTHPHHTINATPYSQLLRIRRISSDKLIF
jgi:hypothetical protein